MKKTIYICGPITDIANNNFEQFQNAQVELEALGHKVLNPHEICRFIEPNSFLTKEEYWVECMRACLSKLPYADVLVTLKDWELSKGAKIEVSTARGCGFIEVMPIIKFLNPTTDVAK